MKKVFALLICGALAIGSLTSCSSTEKSSGSAVEEVSYCDEDFIKDMGKGLDARWDLNESDESKEGYKDIAVNSEESKKMMLNYINEELNYIEKYTDGKFKDTNLQEKAIKYINLLKQHKDLCDYITVDYDKYSNEFQPIYDERSKIIKDLSDNYGLTVSDKHQDTLNEFKTNSKLVEEDESKQAAVTAMLDTINISTTDDGYGNYTCEGYIENNTGYDFDNLSLQFNLYDSDGILVDNQGDYLQNFKNGTKAKIEFYPLHDFETYEVTAEYY